MNVDWRVSNNQSPILFSNKVKWDGFQIRHSRIVPGKMAETCPSQHEINITLAGSLTMEKHTATGGWNRATSNVGNLCLTPAGQPVAAEWDNEFEFVAIDLKPEYVKRAAVENGFSPNVELIETFKSEDPLIQHIGMALLAESKADEPGGRLYAESLSQSLVLHLLRRYSTSSKQSDKFNGGLAGYKLRRVTEFLHENLEQDLTLTEIAEAAGLSQFHFARAFRRTVGLTPQQYLMQIRIDRAKKLLIESDLPLVEVSQSVGFKNQSHFTTLFRKYTALTPKAWREIKHN